jgi:hypothetical protein
MTGRSNALALPFLDVRKQPRNSLAAGETDALGKLALIHQQVHGRRAEACQVADLFTADESGGHVAGGTANLLVTVFCGFHRKNSEKSKVFPIKTDRMIMQSGIARQVAA